MRGRNARAYRALLRLYPRRFRDDYCDEMTRVFAQQLHYARVAEGWVGVLRVWARSLADLVVTAPAEHLEDELVPRPIGYRREPTTARVSGAPYVWVLLGLVPLGVAFFLFGVAPNFMSAMFLNPPGIVGMPAGLVLLAAAALLAVVGFIVIVKTSSDLVRTVALFVFTAVATGMLLMGPTIILIVRNLSV